MRANQNVIKQPADSLTKCGVKKTIRAQNPSACHRITQYSTKYRVFNLYSFPSVQLLSSLWIQTNLRSVLGGTGTGTESSRCTVVTLVLASDGELIPLNMGLRKQFVRGPASGVWAGTSVVSSAVGRGSGYSGVRDSTAVSRQSDRYGVTAISGATDW